MESAYYNQHVKTWKNCGDLLFSSEATTLIRTNGCLFACQSIWNVLRETWFFSALIQDKCLKVLVKIHLTNKHLFYCYFARSYVGCTHPCSIIIWVWQLITVDLKSYFGVITTISGESLRLRFLLKYFDAFCVKMFKVVSTWFAAQQPIIQYTHIH